MLEMLNDTSRLTLVSGQWTVALLERLKNVPGIELSVVCVSPGLPDKVLEVADNLRLYSISQGPAWHLFGFRNLDTSPRFLKRCAEIACTYKPDIIHVHGTERFYGLLGARNLVSAPVVISLQGLLNDLVLPRHYFGVTPIKDIIAMHDLLHLLRGMGPIPGYLHQIRAAKREKEIIKKNKWFMGRTFWDYAHLRSLNPTAHYFHVPEVMRSSFYSNKWDIKYCERHRIIFTNPNFFYRGVETLLEAIVILRKDFPDVRLALSRGVENSPYGKRLLRRIESLGIEKEVEFTGYLNENEMINHLKRSHVFAITSLIENSPNSLCEAQLLGMPAVASYVGGIPSLIDDTRTGLFFPPGDSPILAARIQEIFMNDELAITLGQRARQEALIRHDPDKIIEKVIKTYDEVIIAERKVIRKKINE